MTGNQAFPKTVEIWPEAGKEWTGSDPKLQVQAGNCVHYVCDQRIGRLNYGHFVAPLIRNSSMPNEWLATADFAGGVDFSSPPIGLHDMIYTHGDKDRKVEQAEDILGRMQVSSEIERMGGLELALSENEWERASKPLKAVLYLLPIMFSEHPLAFIDAGLMKALSEDQVSMLVEYSRKKLLCCASNNTALPSQRLGETVVVAMKGTVVGVGSLAWFKSAHEAIDIDARGEALSDLDDETLFNDI